MDKVDIQIERGEQNLSKKKTLDPKGALKALNLMFKSEKFPRPKGKKSPQFSYEEVGSLAGFLFFRSPYVELNVRKRLPWRREMTVKKKLFVDHFFGDAKYNGAKAARMAGYSPRSAKQIAYKIRQT